MASLSQKKGVWYLWIKVEGRRKGISLGTKDRSLAEERARKFTGHGFRFRSSKGMKLKALTDRWKGWHSHFSHNYIETVELMSELFIKHTGNISITEITPQILTEYTNSLIEKKYSRSYVNNRLKNLRTLLSWAVKQNLLIENPFDKNVYIPKEQFRIEFLSKDEIKRLIKAANGELLYQVYIEFLLSTGCRRGEFYNLKWSDINDQYIEFCGKTGKRAFPLNPQINEILVKIRTNSKKIDIHVYTDIKEGKHPKLEETLGRMVKRYIRKAGLKDSYTTHTLRHTFASHLVLKGIPIYTVSKLMGHSNVKTTERYAHLAPERLNVDINYF